MPAATSPSLGIALVIYALHHFPSWRWTSYSYSPTTPPAIRSRPCSWESRGASCISRSRSRWLEARGFTVLFGPIRSRTASTDSCFGLLAVAGAPGKARRDNAPGLSRECCPRRWRWRQECSRVLKSQVWSSRNPRRASSQSSLPARLGWPRMRRGLWLFRVQEARTAVQTVAASARKLVRTPPKA